MYQFGPAAIAGAIGFGPAIEVSWREGEGESRGYGTAGGAPAGYGSCSHYNVRDECKNCCLTEKNTMLASLAFTGPLCHALCTVIIPCHIACAIVEAATLFVILDNEPKCQRNCDKAVVW